MGDYTSLTIPASDESNGLVNKLRQIVDEKEMTTNSDKDLFNISVGDPTFFGNLPIHQVMKKAVKEVVDSDNFNGYGPAHGLLCARQAVAKHYTTPEAPLTEDDVIITCGCAGAIEYCFTVLGNSGQNILVPSPIHPLDCCVPASRGLKLKFYQLLPDRQWEADVDQMDQLIDTDTVAIVVVNPSNPCGSVYSKQHLLDILAVAEKHSLPIIADEIYNDLVFKGQHSYPIATLSKNVPILSCGGMAKKYLVPGWRVGWILIHDRHDRFKKEVVPSLINVSRKSLGITTLVQAALPKILDTVPKSYYENTMSLVEANANIAYGELSVVGGLTPVMPSGALYMMVGVELSKFPHINTTVEFMEKLMSEESVFILCGECFRFPGFIRLVLLIPNDKMKLACDRIREFCNRHYMEYI
ncbi:tyrosine aminotransferase-like isoform X3 [Dysidea avara]|uniref:tyrosine aminotransferase-like isoform X3 n=1 Tax=Dysidea avara TaxID=196820 RepID=UPI00332CBFEE